jgi:transposase-like protein
MGTVRRRHDAKLKCDVALEAIKGGKTVNEIAMNYKVHPVQVSQWKKQCRWWKRSYYNYCQRGDQQTEE